MRYLPTLLALFALSACSAPTPPPAPAPQADVLKLEAKPAVKSVHDGDTFTLSDGQAVRLWGVDAPELKQTHGTASRDALARLLTSGPVQLVPRGFDRYKRALAEVTVNGSDVGTQLVRNGDAWHYQKYAPKRDDLAKAQAEAKANKAGLWSDPAPVAPWDFRAKPKTPGPN